MKKNPGGGQKRTGSATLAPVTGGAVPISVWSRIYLFPAPLFFLLSAPTPAPFTVLKCSFKMYSTITVPVVDIDRTYGTGRN